MCRYLALEFFALDPEGNVGASSSTARACFDRRAHFGVVALLLAQASVPGNSETTLQIHNSLLRGVQRFLKLLRFLSEVLQKNTGTIGEITLASHSRMSSLLHADRRACARRRCREHASQDVIGDSTNVWRLQRTVNGDKARQNSRASWTTSGRALMLNKTRREHDKEGNQGHNETHTTEPRKTQQKQVGMPDQRNSQ